MTNRKALPQTTQRGPPAYGLFLGSPVGSAAGAMLTPAHMEMFSPLLCLLPMSLLSAQMHLHRGLRKQNRRQGRQGGDRSWSRAEV